MKTYKSPPDIEAEVSFLSSEQGVQKKIKKRIGKWRALLAEAKTKKTGR